MKLTHISIKNFKGLKWFETDFGDNTVIKGKNGEGKTSIYDAFLWLLFGKDSDGKKDFGCRPVDKDNNPILGIQVGVTATIDGKVYRKISKEKVVKGDINGFETLCWIDEVPKKIGEYQNHISAIMPEDTFKLLTNLRYFNSLHWTDRRSVLLDIAGEIGTPEGFAELVEALSGRTIDEFKKVLSDKRKLLKKERDDIAPRIDEIQSGLTEYAADEDLSTERGVILGDLGVFQQNREKIHASEVSRQLQLDEISELKRNRGDREGELKADTSGITALIDEKAKLTEQVAGYIQEATDCKAEIEKYETDMHRFKGIIETDTHRLVSIREDYTKALEPATDGKCYACGQSLPEDQLSVIEEKRQSTVSSLIVDGNNAKGKVAEVKSEMEGCQAKFQDSTKRLVDLKEQVVLAEKYKTERFAEIQIDINNNVTPQPMMDDKWKEISAKITALESEVSVDVAGQIQDIDKQIQDAQDELAELDTALANADNTAKAKKRIEELLKKQKELSQSIADLDKQTCEVEKYQAEVSTMIEDAVNGKFAHVRFKLFNTLLNGSVEPCCITLLHGTEYPDQSGGEKIFSGVDIVNVLSEHYKQQPPLFVDNFESITLPIEYAGQLICLEAVDGMELTVEAK